MMDEFHDPELERLLGRAGGANPDVNTALVTMHGRVRHVRRRRAAVATTATCMVLLAGATLAILRSGDAGTGPDEPAGRGTGLVATDGTVTSPTEPASTAVGTPPPVATVPVGSATATITQPGATTAGGTGTTAAPVTTPVTAAPTTTAAVADVVRTFAGTGGSITVRLHEGTLTLLSAAPATGFTVAPDALTSGSRVEVRFTSADHETRIRVDLVAGQMDERVDESGHGKG